MYLEAMHLAFDEWENTHTNSHNAKHDMINIISKTYKNLTTLYYQFLESPGLWLIAWQVETWLWYPRSIYLAAAIRKQASQDGEYGMFGTQP
jgi:hypothetical protein